MNKKTVISGLVFALGEAIYVSLVALFMNSAEKLLGPDPKPLGAIAFLLIFVLSAAISGALILGKPILLYLDGKKREAVFLFSSTLVWISIFLMIVILFLIILK